MNKDYRKIVYRNSNLFRKNKVKFNDIFKNINQIGGSKKLSIKYNDHKYIYEESEIDDNHYFLYSKENEECVFIVISKKDKTAEIHGIGNYKTCLYDSNQNVGSTLLKITLKMLKKYKDKFNIDLIILTDNSVKQCHNKSIVLSLMLVLLTGDTWYGKYGFRPIQIEDNKYVLNEVYNRLYEKNKTTMNTIKISDIDLIKFINKTNNDGLIKATVKLLSINGNMLLKDYLTNLLSNYDLMCDDFEKFYLDLYQDIGLTNLSRQLYGLFI